MVCVCCQPSALADATEDQNPHIGRVIPFPLRFKVGYMRPVSLGLRLSIGKRPWI